MSFVLPAPVAPTIPAAASSPDRLRFEFLASLARRFGWTRGAELGVAAGETTAHLLARCPDLYLIGVDAWQAQPENAGPETYVEWDHGANERAARRTVSPYGDRCRLIDGWTHEVGARMPSGVLDFLWIDADHSEQAVRRDILVWSRALKPGGWLLGHDINWPTVKAAVDDLVPGYEIGPDCVWFRPLNPADGWRWWIDAAG